jgi:hypothetical protein
MTVETQTAALLACTLKRSNGGASPLYVPPSTFLFTIDEVTGRRRGEGGEAVYTYTTSIFINYLYFQLSFFHYCPFHYIIVHCHRFVVAQTFTNCIFIVSYVLYFQP